MELYEIRYFVAVCDARSFSRAAKTVGVSQPALSQCIRKLENELKSPLLQRPIHSMKLTEVGEVVYSYGVKMLDLKKEMDGSIAEIMHGDNVEITIGMSPFYSRHFLPTILQFIKEKVPNVNIRIVEEISQVLEERLLNNELDFCCVPQDPVVPGLSYETICMEELMLATPQDSPLRIHAIPASPVPFLDTKWIRGQKLVSLKQVQKINKLLNPLFDADDLDCDVVYETLDWDTVNIMIGNGLGVGFVPDILYSGKQTATSPLYFRIPDKRFLRHYSIAYKDGKAFTNLERRLIEIFKEQIKAIRQDKWKN